MTLRQFHAVISKHDDEEDAGDWDGEPTAADVSRDEQIAAMMLAGRIT
jgi:hypothetical protein